MKQADSDFLLQVLEKAAYRYQQRGRLSGVLKIGTSIGHDRIRLIRDFFGIDPVRVNTKEEVRLHFDRALRDMPEEEWVNKIGSHLGYTLQPADSRAPSPAVETLISRLRLAYPDLDTIIELLAESTDTLRRLFKGHSEQRVTELCFQVADIVRFLLENETPVTVSELGARYLGDSKLLRQGDVRQLLLEWLQYCLPGLDSDGDEELILASYHVYHDRLTVNGVIYGPVVYTKNGKEFDWIYRLYQQGEAATLSWANLQDIERLEWHKSVQKAPRLICCENEAPFSQLMRQQTGDCLLFTSGFPGSVVCRLYGLLAPQASSSLHWGDTDPNGLYIASLLHAVHPLQLFRCDLETVRAHAGHLRPLTHRQQQRALVIIINDHRFPFREELAYALENGWLEQENWQENGPDKSL